MNAIVIEHVKLSELPEAWRARIPAGEDVRVTVRIEAGPSMKDTEIAEPFVTDDPAFGIWRDREDTADVESYVRGVRASRYDRDGSRNETK